MSEKNESKGQKAVLAENKKVTIGNRKKTRKWLYQKLYATTFSHLDPAEFDDSFFNGVFDFELDVDYLDEMYDLILKKEAYLLKIVSLLAPKFDIQSMGLSYVLPIMIGTCEMLYFSGEIPGKVSLNESIELAKVYGDESSKRIVNGVMNKFYKQFDDMEKELEKFDGEFEYSLFQK